MSFLEKYKPQSISELFGNKIQISNSIKWIKNFSNEDKKVLLLIGSPGIGKTSLAHLLLKEHGYNPVEFNAGDVRSSKMISKKLNKIINNTNIMCMFQSKDKLSIIMDEINSFDRGGIKQLIQTIESTQYKEGKLKRYRLRTPIICICNNDNVKSIKNLKKLCVSITFSYPSKSSIFKFIDKICKVEKIKIKEEYYKYIKKHSQNDFRKILSILEMIKIKYHNKPIKRKYIKESVSILSLKNINRNIFNQVNDIFYAATDFTTINNISQFDSFTIPLIIHQNILNFFKYNLVDKKNNITYTKKKVVLLENYYDKLIDSCKLEQFCFKNYNWSDFTEYINTLSSFNTNCLFNQIPKTIYQKCKKIDYSTLLSKISLQFLNNKNLQLLCQKCNINNNQFQYLSEIILQSISYLKKKNQTQEDLDNYTNIIKYLKEIQLDKKDFDKIIKLNHFNLYWNKKISHDIKKKIFNSIST